MVDKLKENWIPIAVAAIIGTGTGGGAANILVVNHTHPELQNQIMTARHKADVERLKSSLRTMDDLGIPKTHPVYISQKAQLEAASALLAKTE